MMNALHRPDWIPASGHQLRVVGTYFDAVRIEGARGELVAERLVAAAGGDAGPIVCEAIGYRWTYFLLPRGEVRDHVWPLGVQHFGGKGSLTLTYIGIPALDGNTWPLRWYSEPTPTAPYVRAEALLVEVGVTSPSAGPGVPRSPRP